ncbi:MAG: LTA synthase family protein [Bacilli bacterium]|nr:LTA synthase family protein [Bacilli bacterium]
MKGEISEILKKIKQSSKKYFSTNILFSSFIVLSIMIGIILRYNTVGGILSFKPFLGDLLFVIIIGSFGYLIKPKNQFIYFLSWLLFFTVLTIINAIYYEFYQSFVSVNLLATISMVGEVGDSVFEKLKIIHFIYVLAPILLIIIHKNLCKKNYYFEVSKIEKGKKMFKGTLLVGTVLICSFLITLSSVEISRFIKQWNREYIVQRFGLYIYTINDLIQSVQPQIDTLFGYDEAVRNFRNFYEEKWSEKKETNEYTNIFKGKNVVFIHAESMQTFLIDLTINGEEVTPNLNKLSKESLYFSKFYPQISVGTSSDTEFTLLTGIMPSSSGTVFVSYSNRTYEALPQLFKNLGYYTFSMHANNADYWNRKVMHKNLGYDDFYAKDSYIINGEEDIVGLGLNDKSFFEQSLERLKTFNTLNSPYMGTIITLSNHSPFDDLEKYGEYKVTMTYTDIDENGVEIVKEAPYLEDESMGNYLRSAHYADEALGEFFNSIELDSSFDNTVFIIYGDHEAKLGKKQFNLLYNYDPYTDEIKSEDDPTYISLDNYGYDLLKNTPLIIWTKDKSLQREITNVMGMYDVLPTISNMFGLNYKYALGNDIFSSNEKIVIFPNGNFLTNKVYYNNLKDEYVSFGNQLIESDYIEKYKEYTSKRLEISNGIIVHDLIKKEGEKDEKGK